jgi:hypothetical protein
LDPNATLKELRDRIELDADFDVDRVADLFMALDGWLSGGGFLPRDWERPYT